MPLMREIERPNAARPAGPYVRVRCGGPPARSRPPLTYGLVASQSAQHSAVGPHRVSVGHGASTRAPGAPARFPLVDRAAAPCRGAPRRRAHALERGDMDWTREISNDHAEIVFSEPVVDVDRYCAPRSGLADLHCCRFVYDIPPRRAAGRSIGVDAASARLR
jgi:hypothetical protein